MTSDHLTWEPGPGISNGGLLQRQPKTATRSLQHLRERAQTRTQKIRPPPRLHPRRGDPRDARCLSGRSSTPAWGATPRAGDHRLRRMHVHVDQTADGGRKVMRVRLSHGHGGTAAFPRGVRVSARVLPKRRRHHRLPALPRRRRGRNQRPTPKIHNWKKPSEPVAGGAAHGVDAGPVTDRHTVPVVANPTVVPPIELVDVDHVPIAQGNARDPSVCHRHIRFMPSAIAAVPSCRVGGRPYSGHSEPGGCDGGRGGCALCACGWCGGGAMIPAGVRGLFWIRRSVSRRCPGTTWMEG